MAESRLRRPRRQAEPRHVRRRHRRDHQGDPADGRRLPQGYCGRIDFHCRSVCQE